MSKTLLYFNDSHFSILRPESRKDVDFVDGQIRKLDEILQYAKDNVDHVLFGGDLFQTMSPSLNMVYRILNLLQKYKTIRPSLFPIISVIGTSTHDYMGNDKEGEGFGFSVLSIMKTLGFFEFEDTVFLDDGNIEIHKIHSWKELKKPKYAKKKSFKIAMTHHPICKTNRAFFTINTSEVDLGADIVTCAHIHDPLYENDGKQIFINPGSMVRRSVSEKHTPSFYVISTDDKSTKKIEIQCAKPFEECFIVSNNHDDDSIDDFVKSFEKNIQSDDVITHLDNILKSIDGNTDNLRKKIVEKYEYTRTRME